MTDITRTSLSIHGDLTTISVADLNDLGDAGEWGFVARLEFGDNETGKCTVVHFFDDPKLERKRLRKLIKQIKKAEEARTNDE
jgi:hypothetical protein